MMPARNKLYQKYISSSEWPMAHNWNDTENKELSYMGGKNAELRGADRRKIHINDKSNFHWPRNS